MPETEFENAPMADYEDAMNEADFNLSRPRCAYLKGCKFHTARNLSTGEHDPDCPKFEDNSHAPEQPI